MISFRYFGLMLASALVISASIWSCTDQSVSESEGNVQLRELVRIQDTDVRYEDSESIHENRENTITQVVRRSRDAIVSVAFHPRISHKSKHTGPDNGNNADERTDRPDMIPTKRSGFFISPEGHVLTKYRFHLDPGTDISVSMFNGESHPAKIVGSDLYSGITLLKVEGISDNDYIDFGNSDSVMVGEWSIALGVPEDESRMNDQPSVSAGVINALSCMIEYPAFSETIYPDMIRTDAVISPSSEGGPMLDAAGRVIGLNTYIPLTDGSAGTYGYGYAIPGNKVARVINHLADGDNITLNYSVGLEMIPVTKKIVEHYDLQVQQGLLVLGVNRDGPAYESGVLPGDVITRIGVDFIHGDTHAWAVLRRYDKGELMPVTIIRGDDEIEMQILLRERLKKAEEE